MIYQYGIALVKGNRIDAVWHWDSSLPEGAGYIVVRYIPLFEMKLFKMYKYSYADGWCSSINDVSFMSIEDARKMLASLRKEAVRIKRGSRKIIKWEAD